MQTEHHQNEVFHFPRAIATARKVRTLPDLPWDYYEGITRRMKGAEPMKIKLPNPSEFSIEMLAERWRCTTDLILRYVNDGILEMKTSYPAIFEYDPNTGKDEFIWHTVKQYFRLDEVLRFEVKHSPTAEAPEPATTATATPPPTAAPMETTTSTEKPTDENLAKFIQQNPDMPRDKMCYMLFNQGYRNNKIGVAALEGTYRKDSNALVAKVKRLRKKYEKKLGNLTP